MSITRLRAPSEALTIAQICRQSGATARALRHYEHKGLLSPKRRADQARIYSRLEKVRLHLILRGRSMGFTLEQIRLLFETYEREGHDAQAARALLLFRERLAALELKRDQIDDALEVLRAASDRLAAKLEATSA